MFSCCIPEILNSKRGKQNIIKVIDLVEISVKIKLTKQKINIYQTILKMIVE